jgi:hypothetical protein
MTQTKDITDEQVVAACAAWRREPFGPRSFDRLVEATGAPDKVCLRAMERADRRGLIEWGVSIACAWPTPEGERLLEEQRNAKESP